MINPDDYSTGDIILFDGDYIVSRIIDRVIHSQWSHVGIVIKDPTFLFNSEKKEGVFLYESDGKELEDIDSGSKLFGVQMVDLEKKINSYSGTVAHRKLTWNKSPEYIETVLHTVYNTTYHKEYDWNIIDLIDPLIYKKFWIIDKIFHVDHRQTNRFFCSSFVAYIYTQLGLLPKTTEWSLIYPQFFATVDDLQDGGKLGNIDIIKDDFKKHLKQLRYRNSTVSFDEINIDDYEIVRDDPILISNVHDIIRRAF